MFTFKHRKIPLHTGLSITRGLAFIHSPNSYEGKNTYHSHRPIDYATIINKSQFIVVYASSRVTLIVDPEAWFITVAKLCSVILSLLSGMYVVYLSVCRYLRICICMLNYLYVDICEFVCIFI